MTLNSKKIFKSLLVVGFLASLVFFVQNDEWFKAERVEREVAARYQAWTKNLKILIKPDETQEKKDDPKPVTIVAFGDMMLDRYVWTLMQRNGHDYPFQYFPELLSSMLVNQDGKPVEQPDFLFANLEGPISDSKYVNPGTAMVFNFKPVVTEVIKKYGFNLLSVANNHAYDMGEYGMTQTRQHLTEAGIHHFGESKGIKAESVWTTTLKDTTLSFVGFNDTLSDRINLTQATELIQSLEEKSDFTVVSIHWGPEYRTTPTDQQIEYAHAFVQAGADVVLGHHPHVIQYADGKPVEWFEGPDGARPIYYSLGNFIFDQYFQKEVQEGLGVVIQLQKSRGEGKPERVMVDDTVFDILKSQVKRRE